MKTMDQFAAEWKDDHAPPFFTHVIAEVTRLRLKSGEDLLGNFLMQRTSTAHGWPFISGVIDGREFVWQMHEVAGIDFADTRWPELP